MVSARPPPPLPSPRPSSGCPGASAASSSLAATKLVLLPHQPSWGSHFSPGWGTASRCLTASKPTLLFFKSKLARALGSLIQWVATSPWWGLELADLWSPPAQTVLWFCNSVIFFFYLILTVCALTSEFCFKKMNFLCIQLCLPDFPLTPKPQRENVSSFPPDLVFSSAGTDLIVSGLLCCTSKIAQKMLQKTEL